MARTLSRPEVLPATQIWHVGIPIRVSTSLQAANDEGSMKNQLQRIRAYLEFKRTSGEDWREEVVYDLPAVSGKHSLQHPEFLRLQRDIVGGRVNTVVCTELSRVSRNVSEFLQFVELLNVHDCAFICLKQAVDTTTPIGRLMLTFLAALAQFEREQTGERTKDAMAARAQRGLWNGGRILGYETDPNRKGYLSVIDMEAEVVQFAFVTYLACGSIAETVRTLNAAGYRTKAYVSRNGITHPPVPFQISGVQGILKNRAYVGLKEVGKDPRKRTGTADAGPQLVPAVWEPLVEQPLFDEVQALMAKNGQHRTNQTRPVSHAYVLGSGLLACGACGTQMEGYSGHGRGGRPYYYYNCKSKTCRMSVVANEIEDAILDRLGVLASTPDILDGLVAATNTRLQRQLPVLGKRRKALERDLKDVKGQEDRLLGNWTELKATEAHSLLADKMNSLVARQQQIEDAIAEVDEAISRVRATRVDPAIVRAALTHINDVYQHLQPGERKELFGLIVHRAEVHANQIVLELHSEALGGGAEGLHALDASGRVKSRFESPVRLPDEDSNLEPSG